MESSLVGEQTIIIYGLKMTITALTFTLACVCTQLWPTGFTIWSLVIALFMGESYIYPLDVRYSANRSNQL
jgi:hypothetical protein